LAQASFEHSDKALTHTIEGAKAYSDVPWYSKMLSAMGQGSPATETLKNAASPAPAPSHAGWSIKVKGQ